MERWKYKCDGLLATLHHDSLKGDAPCLLDILLRIQQALAEGVHEAHERIEVLERTLVGAAVEGGESVLEVWDVEANECGL